MTQEELLTSSRLRLSGLSDNVRRSAAQPGRVLLRSAGGVRRLVLTPTQAAILTDGFV
jgi:hypothetical protein